MSINVVIIPGHLSQTFLSPAKRSKVPSPEKRQPRYSISHVSPKKSVTLLNASLLDKIPLPTPTAGASDPVVPSSAIQDTTSQTLHLAFEFSLFVDGKQRHPTTEECKLIAAVFSCYRILSCPPFLVLRCHKLPPKPWPLTIAGIPAWFTVSTSHLPISFGVTGHGSPIEIHPAPALWKTPSQAMFQKIVEIYKFQYFTQVLSIGWLGTRFLVTLPKGSMSRDVRKLPALIGRILVTYTISQGASRHREVALRSKLPTNEIRDDTNYYGSTLRPGLMMSCGDVGEELLTTSGIPLVDKDGKFFVSVASHGFPLGRESVFHPTAQGDHIGDVKAILWDTDISLMSLRDGISYSTESFGSRNLRGLLHPDELRLGSELSMDSPFSGGCQGVLTMIEHVAIPTDEPSTETSWLNIIWVYLGNGRDEPMDGSCGSVIWDEEDQVVGFFRFAHENGFSLATSALPLIEIGMSLKEIV